MTILIELFMLLFLPILVMFLVVGAIHWLLDKLFGYDPVAPYQIGFHQTIQAEFLQKAGSFSNRKSKATPHYDAFVEAEWQASRLEDKSIEEDIEEVHSLGELLENSEKE